MIREAQKVLPLFRHILMTNADRAALRRVSDNWLTIHAHIKAVEGYYADDKWSSEQVQYRLTQLLLLEISDHMMRPRWHIINRLHTRIVKWRKFNEMKELRTWLDRCGKAASSGI